MGPIGCPAVVKVGIVPVNVEDAFIEGLPGFMGPIGCPAVVKVGSVPVEVGDTPIDDAPP